MKKISRLLLIVALLATFYRPVEAQGVFTFQSAAVANGNGGVMSVGDASSVAVSVGGSLSGGTTVNFEVSLDPTQTVWTAAMGTNYADLTQTATPTVTGSWNVQVAGNLFFRCRISAYSAGTLTITGRSSSYFVAKRTFALPSSLVVPGTITSYDGIATAGLGIPVVVAFGRFNAQVAAKASVAAFTVGAADGSFEVSANVLVTAATTASFSVTCAYTDESNTSRTLNLSFSQVAGGAFLATITNATGVGPYEGVPLHIRCKASTSITLATSGTFTSVSYNVEGAIRQFA